MKIKDYYSILQVAPSASYEEIKQAYRKLAMQWHPDKNPGDAYAAIQFHEIKEAYEVLTHPVKKDQYLQQRWYNQAMGRKRTGKAITPENVLREALELRKYVSSLDEHRMDHLGLAAYLLDISTNETVNQLATFNDSIINRQIIKALLDAASPLSYAAVLPVCRQLEQLAGDDPINSGYIRQFLLQHQRAARWEKWKMPLALLLTLLLCLLIWLVS